MNEKKAKDRGEVLPKEERFDSNCITPGTPFMTRQADSVIFCFPDPYYLYTDSDSTRLPEIANKHNFFYYTILDFNKKFPSIQVKYTGGVLLFL
jgi:hypothetical protein